MEINIPTSYTVAIASTKREWTIDLTGITQESVVHLIQHAIKQKLGDAAAGAKKAVELGEYEDTVTAACEMVAARMETVLNVPTPGEARFTMSLTDKAILSIVRAKQADKKVKGPDRAKTVTAARAWIDSVAGARADAVWLAVEMGAIKMVEALATDIEI